MIPFRAFLEATGDDDWNTETVRSADGKSNCLFGHLFNFGTELALTRGGTDEDAQKYANRTWEAFEETWATTYVIYPVNDGKHPKYQQDTPKQRVLAYLDALLAGEEETTYQSMESWARSYEAERGIISPDNQLAATS